MQPVRQIAHVFGNLLRPRPRLGRETLGVTRISAPYVVEIHGQQGQLLGDVVVQFACYPRALDLLCAEQARSEVTDPRVARTETSLAPAQFSPLHEQRGNEHGLYEQEGEGRK